jgi:hypothetical protein
MNSNPWKNLCLELESNVGINMGYCIGIRTDTGSLQSKDLVQYPLLSGIKPCHPPISDLALELEFIKLIHLPFQMKRLILPQL